ncbi:4-hydroxy-tetrahydrodipicolinate synthase [Permianibacter aggregans]|uniref:4-hydroxy-tetrahydrodipicolinate synthase n=1 Tax=Permianibacter aggregans TaxID=1510150 RepID=A0A4R6UVC0_9GAMM|nr:4-hydroxy-tetrahydrodipicolinate synthase [Permianibacter aggregans]QGX41487.1 4-hydroxy-tetrahydrodipicolinate synthase [Permianibacter aggregans]TDQ51280.1 dihydrodipicolinate synthase [Permianibacter aggregans]
MFRGSIVALITPMTANGGIDTARLKQLVEWHIGQGTHGIVAMGTTGESATLTDDEYLHVVKTVVETVAARIPVIAGTGSAATAKAVALTRKAESLGVDGTLCVTPYYLRPTQEGLYQHFIAVADAAAKPVLLYNVPGRTGCDLLPETVIRLAKHSQIAGIKEATGKLERLSAIQAGAGKDFLMLSGDDATACAFMLQGGHGVISVTSNVAPKAMAEMCEAALANRVGIARELDERLQGLHNDLFVEPNPTPAKWAVSQLLGGSDNLRLPLLPLTEANKPVVRAAMRRAGVIE